MKIKSGVEQAVCILVILATQSDKQHVKSETISTRLHVSPSYLKKVMRKLVISRLITSVPGNSGGFSLARSPNSITMLDILDAIESDKPFLQTEGLIQRVFPETTAAEAGSERLERIFLKAEKSYRSSLQETTLAEAIHQTLNRETIELVNWNHSLGSPDIEELKEKK
ncbi:RrF2 family transcriptional regulator [Shouchella patagoniensis]|uniref:RrF2 family transcriptional regulator n=1 Tax=Shouchella patagoniensis TaxID=228576 RepID=UPI000995447B|nr:Rrf2 family transcriptional regulator [Shouchella patagoniensis]